MAKKIEGYANRHNAEEKFPVVFNTLPYDHESAPCTIVVHSDRHERVFTESEVRAMLDELKDANRALSELRTIARRHGISLDPA